MTWFKNIGYLRWLCECSGPKTPKKKWRGEWRNGFPEGIFWHRQEWDSGFQRRKKRVTIQMNLVGVQSGSASFFFIFFHSFSDSSMVQLILIFLFLCIHQFLVSLCLCVDAISEIITHNIGVCTELYIFLSLLQTVFLSLFLEWKKYLVCEYLC